MRIAVDTHVHLYPDHAADRLLGSAHDHLKRIAPDAERFALCLTERAGHTAFADLAAGTRAAPGWTLHATPEPAALLARSSNGAELLLLAGRQIVTTERLEVLALGADERWPDGQPIRDVLNQVHAARALAVLPWGLGKWLGARGALMQRLIANATPGDFALADTYLLPVLTRRPPPLRRAEKRGFRILAGTDPLGRAGEESIAGRYGVLVEGAWNDAQPATSLLRLLGDTTVPLRTIGRRGSLGETIRRMR
jgi:hypothetical protein